MQYGLCLRAGAIFFCPFLRKISPYTWVVYRALPLLALVLLTVAACAQIRFPKRQIDSNTSDLAGLIRPDDRLPIWQAIEKYGRVAGAPIEVVTIPSLKEFSADSMTTEEYAGTLFENWGMGAKKFGVLVLVTGNDHKASIQVGKSWPSSLAGEPSDVLRQQILPAFRAGHFSFGIRSGVEALSELNPKHPVRHQGLASTSEVQTSREPGSLLNLGPFVLESLVLLLAIVFLWSVAGIFKELFKIGARKARGADGDDGDLL